MLHIKFGDSERKVRLQELFRLNLGNLFSLRTPLFFTKAQLLMNSQLVAVIYKALAIDVTWQRDIKNMLSIFIP